MEQQNQNYSPDPPQDSPSNNHSYQSLNSGMSAREMRRFKKAANSISQLQKQLHNANDHDDDHAVSVAVDPGEAKITEPIELENQPVSTRVNPPISGVAKLTASPRESRRLFLQQQQNQQQQNSIITSIEDEVKPKGVKRSAKIRTDIVSPAGDEHLILEPEDFVMPRRRSNEVNNSESVDKKNTLPSRNQTPGLLVEGAEDGIIYVQERGRFRRTTAIEAQATRDRLESNRNINSTGTIEIRLFRLMKKIHLYTVAVSYCAYGLAAGLGLATLIFIPFTPPSFPTIAATETATKFLEFASSGLVRFLAWYSRTAVGLSNAFSILTTIILLHAIDTRNTLKETRRRVEDAPASKPSTPRKESVTVQTNMASNTATTALLRRRTLIAATMLCFAWISFLANIILFCVDDRLSETEYFSTNASSGIGGSPYNSFSGITPPGMNSVADWYWGALFESAANNTPAKFQQDITTLAVLNTIRGLSLIFCWALGLVEIKLRSSPKRSTTTPAI